MKREVVFIFIFLFFLISISSIYSSEEDQVEKAYTCLEDRINQTNCSTSFSFEDKVFSLLATRDLKCKNEVMLENLSNQCWPKSGCNIKSTAQAVLALEEQRVNTTKAEKWLLGQTSIPTNIDWFLEIESSSSTSCVITYSGSSYTISIGENKKISSNAGTYLTLAQDNYWLKISPEIYNTNINILCDKAFMTTLLFKKKDSSTIQVSETVHDASARGSTTEKVDSFCFSQGGICNYEGSLWATMVLYSLKYDVSKFTPYLITMMDEELNQHYIPESFLYFITGKFDTKLLSKQKIGSYWEESGDKYYDTALALWPLYYESSLEKENSKSWLLGVQQNTGCWNNGNLRDTAFILYSIWPTSSPFSPEECVYDSDCPEISGKVASCYYGTCYYDYANCIDDDGICGPGCDAESDNDCYGNACDSDSDCDIYLPEIEKYCSYDNTQVLESTSNWICGSEGYCIKDETSQVIENCSDEEECYSGSCLGTNGIGTDDCEDDYDCDYGEYCSEGYCVINPDCVDEGYFCMSQINCEGEILYDYGCTGIFKCCDTEISLNTCFEEGGEICASDERCIDGITFDVSDTAWGEVCCVGGTCEEDSGNGGGTYNCGGNDGTCRSSCWDDEEKNSDYDCEGYGELCCVEKDSNGSSSLWWLWILLILILFSTLGIVFRDKLRTQLLKLKTKFGKKDSKRKFSMPLFPHSNTHRRILPRRILPPQTSRDPIRKPLIPQRSSPTSKKPKEKPKNELDDVLKKLKEMGK